MGFSLRYWLGRPHADYYKSRAFRSNADMFDFCAEWGERFPVRKRPMVGLVCKDITESTLRSGTAIFNEEPPSDARFYSLLIAAQPECLHTTSFVIGRPAEELSADDLIAWVPIKHHAAIGWHGVIVAKLRPALCRYGPEVDTLY